MAAYWLLFTFLFTLPAVSLTSPAQECYSCSYNTSAGEEGNECLTLPTTRQNCNTENARCYTKFTRNTQKGEIILIERGCDESDALREQDCMPDPDLPGHQICTVVCDEGSLCNAKNERTMCYACEYNYNPGTNDTCVKLPELHLAVTCYFPATCYTRGSFLSLENRMNSFSRGCADYFRVRKECRQSAQFYDCLSVCCQDHCNTGDGSRATTDPICLAPTQPPPSADPNPSNAPTLRSRSAGWMTAFVVLMIASIFY